MDNAQAGGSGAGRNVPVNNQNVVINANAQNAAAQMAQQILANTNVTLKQELVKIPDFWGEKAKDTVTATQFMARIDECQVANDWNDTMTYANFSLCLRGKPDIWLVYSLPSRVDWLKELGHTFVLCSRGSSPPSQMTSL